MTKANKEKSAPQAPIEADANPPSEAEDGEQPTHLPPDKKSREIGGPKGPEPTRYGDWERKGIVSDF